MLFIVPLLSSKYCIFLRRDSVLLYQVWVGTIDTFFNKSEIKLQYGYVCVLFESK